jgi:coenzyme F420 hydrogenase subunit beta
MTSATFGEVLRWFAHGLVGKTETRTKIEQVPVPSDYRGTPEMDEKKCIACGSCAEFCPGLALSKTKFKDSDKADHYIAEVRCFVGHCIYCAECERYCPTGAITLSTNWITPVFEPHGLDRAVHVEVNTKKKFYEDLERDVIEAGLCTSCGACVASCPLKILRIKNDKANRRRKTDTCKECGVCYIQCPRAGANPYELASGLFTSRGDEKYKDLGVVRSVYSAKALDSAILGAGQDGGVVTALLKSLFDRDEIDSAVVAATGKEPWKPQPLMVVDANDIMKGSGTKYTVCSVVSVVRDLVDGGMSRMAVVGTPCHIQGVRSVQFGLSNPRVKDAVKYAIGIFCMENFDYDILYKQKIEKEMGIPLTSIKKLNVKKGAFWIQTADKEYSIPLGDLKGAYIRNNCHFCSDFSAELADISVGSVGSPDKMSTVVIRTDAGFMAWRMAVDANAVEYKSIEDVKPGYNIVKKLNSEKKENAKKSLEERKSKGLHVPQWG